MYPRSNFLAGDSYGPPAPGQTYQQFQSQMSPVAVAGIAALALVNPIAGIAVGIGYLLTRSKGTRATNRFSKEEIKGGH